MSYFINALNSWNDFSGKIDRKSFWMFYLILILMGIPIGFVQSFMGFEELNMIYLCVMLIPYMAAGFRRLNDAKINKFLFLIPFIGLILAAFPSKHDLPVGKETTAI